MAKTQRRRTLVLVVGACLVVAVGAAVAFWRSGGLGSGSGASGTAAVITLSPATPTAQLYPGGSADVKLSMANSGQADVRVSGLSLAPAEGDGGFETDDDHADCGVDSLGFATQTNGGVGWDVPAGGSLTVTLSSSLTMSTGADDACQGATLTVHLRVSA